ncbi:Retrovirus-related Pol polyprotein from type-2 retrotransposable element R2DM, partial [Sesamum angolense]
VLSRWRWFVDYAGPGNRIWIAWNDELIDVEFLNVGSQFVHCSVLIHELHETILITVVYGANEVSTRRELWQGLIELAVTVGNVPWLVGGDFNAVLDMSEVSGASGDIRVAMNEFNDCILQTGLLSMPMQGECFTWHNCSLDGRSLWKRHDRLLVNDVWMDRWPNLFYTCLTPRTSDHSPLVLKGDCRNMQVNLFRFDNYLALSPGFLASVHSIWRHPVIGTLIYSVTRILKALKSVFRQQRRSKGDLAMNVKLAAGFLEVAQNILQFDRHNSLLLLLEHCCRLVYLKASKLEQGLLGGDRTDRAIDLRYLRPWARHILTDDEARAIIHPVTIDEVKIAFFDIEEDKAPIPDGFSSGFFKAAWPVVGEEVSKAIIDFFKTGRLLKQLNATLLTLIPKVRTPHSVAEFRPISYCNVICKVISKIIVSRIREILDLLISPSQNAFVPGRLISDNILLAQELFSGYNQCRLPPRRALKVDLRKAYDTVEWDFLIATLRMFGFPAVFIRWIEEYVTSAHYSVVVNCGVHGFFAGARGLRQGDPMSPYLFVLVMEVLHMILQQLIEQDGNFSTTGNARI